MLKKAIARLPVHTPGEDLWERIEEGISLEEKPKKKLSLWKIAASLLLIASLGISYTEYFNGADEVSFTEEIGIGPEMPIADFLVDDKFMELLDDECVDTRLVCQEVDFQNLLARLTEVQVRAGEVVVMADETGYDKFLMKAKSRLEKEDAEIKKEIIAYLRN